MKLIDRRDIVPAELIDKTKGVINGAWGRTAFTGGTGSVTIYAEVADNYQWIYEDDVRTGYEIYEEIEKQYPPDEPPSSPAPNILQYGWASLQEIGAAFSGSGIINVSTGPLGMPFALQHLPDGAEILAAKCEVSVTSLTRLYTYAHVVDGFDTQTDTSEVELLLIGLSPGDDWSVIGGFPQGNPDGTSVVDCTGVMQTLFAARGSYKSFALLPGPPGLGGDLIAFLRGKIGGLPEIGTHPVSNELDILETWRERLTWGGASVGNIWLKVAYPDGGLGEHVVHRWPPLGAVPGA